MSIDNSPLPTLDECLAVYRGRLPREKTVKKVVSKPSLSSGAFMEVENTSVIASPLIIFEDHTNPESDDILLTCEVYRNDIRYRVNSLSPIKENSGIRKGKSKKRSRIICYSEKSKKNYKFVLRNTSHLWTHEMEVGYPADYPRDGLIVKMHRKLLVESLQRKYPGINWTWRQGFQERGAPHLHFLVDRFVDYNWLAETWARIVGSDDINHIKAGTHVDKIRNVGKMIHYMVNYMADDPETIVPEGYENVGRFWGVKRGIVEMEMFQKILPSRMAARSMRLFKRWYKAELRSWGIYKWKPKVGAGFTAIGGRRLFDVLMKLRV